MPRGTHYREAGSGFRCPSCDADSTVLETRGRGGGLRRRRSCTACGARFTTLELLAPQAADGGTSIRDEGLLIVPADGMLEMRKLIERMIAPSQPHPTEAVEIAEAG